MKPRILTLGALVLALGLLGWPDIAHAADQGRQRGGGQRTGTAAPRGGTQASPPSRGGSVVRAPSGGSGTRAASPPRGSAVAADQGRTRGGRPAAGRAVAREGQPRGYRAYVAPSYYPYGTFGLGYFYYDPYYWGPYGYGGYPYGYGSRYGARYYRAEPYGSLKLKVTPRQAEVYVDGYYAGQVDDFDGVFQALNLEAGPHRVEIRAVGFEPLVVEVKAEPGRTVTYRGEMQPAAVK